LFNLEINIPLDPFNYIKDIDLKEMSKDDRVIEALIREVKWFDDDGDD
jgi:hypothetical protein